MNEQPNGTDTTISSEVDVSAAEISATKVNSNIKADGEIDDTIKGDTTENQGATQSSQRKTGTVPMLLISVLVVVVFAGAIFGITQLIAANENSRTITESVRYQGGVVALEDKVPSLANYVKENYKVEDLAMRMPADTNLESIQATPNDITKEEAADIGAKALWAIYDVQFLNETIDMMYSAANEDYRASWWGTCHAMQLETHKTFDFTFEVDSITGELLQVSCLPGFYKDVLDQDSLKNPSSPETLEAVKQQAEMLNLVGGKVAAVDRLDIPAHKPGGSYVDPQTGEVTFSESDPQTIVYFPLASFLATGENGQLATLTISLVDYSLLAVHYNDTSALTTIYSEGDTTSIAWQKLPNQSTATD